MGGRSSEREISLRSGAAVVEALAAAGVTAVALDMQEDTEQEVRRLIFKNGIDIVFVAMHGGFGEGGALQRILGKIGIPFTGPGEAASRLAMDKLLSRRAFAKAGLQVPRTRALGRRSTLLSSGWWRYPLVVKPRSEGSSIGIALVDSRSQLRPALESALRFGDIALAEEFIEGRELTVSVLDQRTLPVVEIIPKSRFFDFQAKYEKGSTEYRVPADLDPKVAETVQRDALAAYRALGCRHLSRIDIILKEGRIPVILEVNTIPGMTSVSLFPKAARAAGLSFEDLCVQLVQLAWRDNGKE